MLSTPFLLAICLVIWNFGTYVSDPTDHFSDRLAITVAFALLIECFAMLTFSLLAWILVSPGIAILVSWILYRLVSEVKSIKMGFSSGRESESSFSTRISKLLGSAEIS